MTSQASATLEAPAQAELRPTCAGASSLVSPDNLTPKILARILIIIRRAKIVDFTSCTFCLLQGRISRTLEQLILGAHVAGECDAGNPGAGRAKLRLSRGFQLGLAQQCHPPKVLARIYLIISRCAKIVNLRVTGFLSYFQGRASRGRSNNWFWGAHVAGECDAGSPGSGGASPYLRRRFQLVLAGQPHPKNSRSDLFDHFTLWERSWIFASRVFCLTPRSRISRTLEQLILGGDVAGKCDAGSPGSGGASPYLRRRFQLALAGQPDPKNSRSDFDHYHAL